MFSWIGKGISKVLGTGGTDSRHSLQIHGRLLFYDADAKPRTIFLSSTARLVLDDEKGSWSWFLQVIEEGYEEIEEQEQEDDDDLSETHSLSFHLTPSLAFARVLSPHPTINAFCWKASRPNSVYVFQLKASASSKQEANSFEKGITSSIYEAEHRSSAVDAAPSAVACYCSQEELPFDLDTLNPLRGKRLSSTYSSPAPKAASSSSSIVSPSPLSPVYQPPVNVSVTPQTPYQPQKQERQSTPPSAAASSSSSAPLTPKTPVISGKSKATPVPKSPVNDYLPEIQYEPISISSASIEEERHCCIKADLCMFSEDDKAYKLRLRSVYATLSSVGDPATFERMMFIEQEGRKIMGLSLGEMDIQATFFKTPVQTMTWTFMDKNKPTFWSLVFPSSESLEQFRIAFNIASWEAKYGEAWKKVKDEDREWILNANAPEHPEQPQPESEVADAFDMLAFEDDEIYESDSDKSEDESEEEEEEDDPRTPGKGAAASGMSKTAKNSLLADSALHHRAFVARGDSIGVFNLSDEDAEFDTMIAGIKTLNGGVAFTPSHMMLHNQETQLLLLHPDQESERTKGKIFNMDLGTGRIVEEWDSSKNGATLSVMSLQHSTKNNQVDPDPTVVAINRRAAFMIDPRDRQRIIGDPMSLQSASQPRYSVAATTGEGELAIASEGGEIRLFNGVPGAPKGSTSFSKNAKTLLPGCGDPIIGLDTTADGSWLLATCKSYLLAIPTSMPNGADNGFQKRMGKDKPHPRRLNLLPDDVARVGGVINFTPARFNTGADGETWLCTSTGRFVIAWNFKKVQQNRLNEYTIRGMGDAIVSDQFVTRAHGESGSSAPVVWMSSDDVGICKRVTRKDDKRQSSSAKYDSLFAR